MLTPKEIKMEQFRKLIDEGRVNIPHYNYSFHKGSQSKLFELDESVITWDKVRMFKEEVISYSIPDVSEEELNKAKEKLGDLFNQVQENILYDLILGVDNDIMNSDAIEGEYRVVEQRQLTDGIHDNQSSNRED